MHRTLAGEEPPTYDPARAQVRLSSVQDGRHAVRQRNRNKAARGLPSPQGPSGVRWLDHSTLRPTHGALRTTPLHPRRQPTRNPASCAELVRSAALPPLLCPRRGRVRRNSQARSSGTPPDLRRRLKTSARRVPGDTRTANPQWRWPFPRWLLARTRGPKVSRTGPGRYPGISWKFSPKWTHPRFGPRRSQ